MSYLNNKTIWGSRYVIQIITWLRNRSLCLSIIILISVFICRISGITTEKVFDTLHEISISRLPLIWSLIITYNILRFSLFHFFYLLHILGLFHSFVFFRTHIMHLLVLNRLFHINTLCLCLSMSISWPSFTLYLLLNSHLFFHLLGPFDFFGLHLLSHLLVGKWSRWIDVVCCLILLILTHHFHLSHKNLFLCLWIILHSY